jgi:hypothetical protein
MIAPNSASVGKKDDQISDLLQEESPAITSALRGFGGLRQEQCD